MHESATAPSKPLEARCEWTRESLGERYVHELSAEHVAEIEAALAHAEAQTTTCSTSRRDDFPLPDPRARARTTSPTTSIDGRGVVLLRGLPVDRYTKDRVGGDVLGHRHPPRSTRGRRTRKGHLLGDVTDQGKAVDDPTSRGNEIGGVPFPFHSDGSDLVGLLCLDAGLPRRRQPRGQRGQHPQRDWSRTRPDLAAALYEPLPYDFRGEQAPGAKGWYEMPVFSRAEGPAVHPLHPALHRGSRAATPTPPPSRPTPARPWTASTRMCADPQFHVSMTMRPGDMQFVNNYHVLHARQGYEDDRAAGKIRHLKRLWLETDCSATTTSPSASASAAPTRTGRARDAPRARSRSERDLRGRHGDGHRY